MPHLAALRISGFAGMLPWRRPLAGLDVGSGTCRFTQPLAQARATHVAADPDTPVPDVPATMLTLERSCS